MASRNEIAKTRQQKAPKSKILIKLSHRAAREANALFKRSKAGTITKAKLSSGLKQLEVPLQQMVDNISTTVKDVSKLRAEANDLGTAELNIELKKIKKRVNRLLDHSGPKK